MAAASDNQPTDMLLRIARVRQWEADGATHLRLAGVSPFMTFLFTLVVEAVVLGFAYPMTAMVYNPQPIPLPLIMVAIAVAVGLAVVLSVRKHSRIASGAYDLVIRDDNRSMTLPANFGRNLPIDLSFDDICDIAPADEVPAELGAIDAFERKKYEKRAIRPDDQLRPTGHRGEINHAVVVCTPDADRDEERLLPIARWTEFRRANALALWLRKRLDFSGPVHST